MVLSMNKGEEGHTTVKMDHTEGDVSEGNQ